MTQPATLLLSAGGALTARTAAWVARQWPGAPVLLSGAGFAQADLALLPAEGRLTPLAADDIGSIEATIRMHDVRRIVRFAGLDEPRDGSLSMLEATSRYLVPFAALVDLCIHAWQERQAPVPHRLLLAVPAAVLGNGSDDGFPVHEHSALAPANSQMAAIAAMQLALSAAHARYGLDTATTYIGNLVGTGDAHDRAAAIIHAVLSGKRVPVYGEGEQLIDLLSADEAACMLSAALARAEPGSTHGLAGPATSALSLAGLVCQAIDAAFLADASLAARFPHSPMAHGERAAELVTRVADRRQAVRAGDYAFAGYQLLGERATQPLSASIQMLVDGIVRDTTDLGITQDRLSLTA